jgi:hypothetical protein
MMIDQLSNPRIGVRDSTRHNPLIRRASILGLAAERMSQRQLRLVGAVFLLWAFNGLSLSFHLVGSHLHPEEQHSHQPPR